MLEVLQFIFSSIWVFLGVVILSGIVTRFAAVVILGTIVALKGGNVKIK